MMGRNTERLRTERCRTEGLRTASLRATVAALSLHLFLGLSLCLVAGWVGLGAPAPANAQTPQLDDRCVVSVLNRTAQVKPDGTWSIPNAPANTGLVRARASCTEDDGTVRSGQSDFFLIPANGAVEVPDIRFGVNDPTPASLTLTAEPPVLEAEGATGQILALATFADGSTRDVTAPAAGTTYLVSNPAVATVSAEGQVTAIASGTVVISALNDGALGLATVRVQLSGDTDGDGIPDDVELDLGLDPTNPVDALEDTDNDDLTNREELVDFGTDPRQPDTDGDTLVDGEEVFAGEDGFVTSPVLPDTDGDGLRDALEIATASDPTDPASFNLAAALDVLTVAPEDFVLTVNTLLGEATRQLTVSGTLIDGFPIDLTSEARGTTYASSNLAVCSFGLADGLLFGGAAGTCTVTASNAGFSASTTVTVRRFAPTALAFVSLPGYGNNVDVSGDFAFVASGAAGLAVVDVSDRSTPTVVATADTPGNANDVKIVGDLAYVADGASGLQIFDVSNPFAPSPVSALDTPGNAQDVTVRGGLAYVADGSSLQIVDVSDAAAPAAVGSLNGTSTRGVDVADDGLLGVVAEGGSGIRVVDLADPSSPSVLASLDTGDARDVVVAQGFAYVADFSTSFTAVDLSDPTSPTVTGRTPLTLGGRLHDVTFAGGFGFGADVLFVNGVPIVDVRAPATPVPSAILDFQSFRDDNGTGIAVDASHLYLTASRSIQENGTTGDTRLYVGQYLQLDDTLGVPPTVAIESPQDGETVIEGSQLPIVVNATDDFAVAAVEILVNGNVAFRDTGAPFGTTISVPEGITELVLGARAVDLAGNAGLAPQVTLAVIPDPLTEAVGRVVDPDGNPVADAELTVNGGLGGLSEVDGTFSLPGVPTILGDIQVEASAVIDGKVFRGDSDPTPPVPAGVTDVGEVALKGEAVVGYYNLTSNRGASTQVAPIVTAGHIPVDVGDLRTADLDQFDVLFVQNSSNSGYSSIYLNELPRIFDWIEAGGVLIFHDRHVANAENVLPGAPGNILRNFSDDRNIQILDDTTLVTDGPGGIVTNTSLDGGNSSSHGFVLADSVPADAVGILSTGTPDNWVLYTYGFGTGQVVYSTIPLDFYLAGSGPSGVSTRIRTVYAPNVVAWGADLR